MRPRSTKMTKKSRVRTSGSLEEVSQLWKPVEGTAIIYRACHLHGFFRENRFVERSRTAEWVAKNLSNERGLCGRFFQRVALLSEANGTAGVTYHIPGRSPRCTTFRIIHRHRGNM